MTSNGRQPQNIKSRISYQPMIGLNANFKCKVMMTKPKLMNASYEDDLKWKTTSKY